MFYKIFIGCLWFIFSQIAIYFAQLGIAYVFGNVVSEPKEDAPAIYYFIGCLWFIFSQIAIYFAQSNDDESMEKIE